MTSNGKANRIHKVTNICCQLISFLMFNTILTGISTSIVKEKYFLMPDDCIKMKNESFCDCYATYSPIKISCTSNPMKETVFSISPYSEPEYIYVRCDSTTKDFDIVPYLKFHFTIKRIQITKCPLLTGNSNMFDKFHISQNELKEIIIDDIPNITEILASFFEPFKNTEYLSILKIINNNLTNLPNSIFRNQQKLLHLDLSFNKLRNLTKDDFKGLSNLKVLILNGNDIEVLEKNLFEFLPMLERLTIEFNKLRELPKELFLHNKNLKEFYLSNTDDVLGVLPIGLLSNLPKLEKIILISCLKTINENVFNNSTMMKTIHIRENNFTTLEENIFKDQKNLEELNFNNNRLTTLPEKLLYHQNNLKELDLSNNLLAELPENLFHNLESLIALDLSDNLLAALPENLFKNNKNLEMLDLSNNRIKEINKNIFNSLIHLKGLYLYKNNLTTVDAYAFQDLISIKYLKLQNNNIEKVDFLNLHKKNINKEFYILRYFDLSYNNISKVDLNNIFWKPTSPLEVDFSHNKISSIDFENISYIDQIFPRISINLGDNPFNCDCRLLKSVKFLLKESTEKKSFIFNIGNLVCHKPESLKNKLLLKLSPIELLCPINQELCPLNCSCSERIFDSTFIVDCSHKNMSSIPKLPSPKSFNLKGTELNMSNNNLHQILSINPNNIGHTNITKLILKGNQLKEICVENLPRNLTGLDLSYNQFENLNDEVLTYLSNSSTLQTLQLSGNPWKCDCKASKLMEYVLINHEKFTDLKNMRCSGSFRGKTLYKLYFPSICPMNNLSYKTTIWLLSIFAVFSLLIILLLICYQRYEIEIKIWLYARNMCLWFVNEEELDRYKLYDAFISYSSKDEDFVANYLIPDLENGTPAFKTCVHYRDFRVGQNIGENISYAIENSRRTIVLLSKNFLESNWAREEFRTAHVLALEERKPKVIVILFGDIGNIDDIDEPELKAYLKTNTYLTANDPWFWDRLRYAMPHSTLQTNELNGINNAVDNTFDHELELLN